MYPWWEGTWTFCIILCDWLFCLFQQASARILLLIGNINLEPNCTLSQKKFLLYVCSLNDKKFLQPIHRLSNIYLQNFQTIIIIITE